MGMLSYDYTTVTTVLDDSCSAITCADVAVPTALPVPAPTALPVPAPTALPVPVPTAPSPFPTIKPSFEPTKPTQLPTALPSLSLVPSQAPTNTLAPSITPRPTYAPTASLVAGVTVKAPPVLNLAEDGSATAKFNITLDTEPLSAVRVDFTSSLGSMAFSPSYLSFDYSNYNIPQVVTVSAINDDVDQGATFEDSVVPAVSSDDDFDECDSDRLRSTVCAQAALYADYSTDFPLSTITATIVDDDTAGVTVTAVSLQATFDNYGDALTSATYTIVLDSEPTSDVVVSLSGLTSFSTATPSSVTLGSADWDAAVTVTIAGSAPTTNRPACFSGNRYCNEVVNRTEVIAHASASSDAFYSAIAVDGMKVLVDVVYDASDPPAIKKGLFANLLNSISITFDQDTDRAGLSGLFSCSSILDMTPLEVRRYFGLGSMCSFTSNSVL
jgi:hypothetical protein